jgi:hypothetical protein
MTRVLFRPALVTLGLIITLTLTATAVVRAQAREGSLTGKITDATGAVIVGASVFVVQNETNLRRDVVTAADGTFVIERLLAGTYIVTARIDRFTPSRPESVTLAAGARQTLAIELQVAPLAEGMTTVYGAKTGRSLVDTPASVGVVDAARMDASAMFRIEDGFGRWPT